MLYFCVQGNMAAEVAKPFNDDDLLTDKISKKDLVIFLQENASSQVGSMLNAPSCL